MSPGAIRLFVAAFLLASFVGCSSDNEEGATPANDVTADVTADVGDEAADDVGEHDDVADTEPNDSGDCTLEDDRPPTPEIVYVENGTFGCDNVLLAPDPGEEGFLAAARLTPPEYPFAVTAIAYPLGHGPSGTVTCNSALEHHAYVFAHDAVAPPAEPSVAVDLVAPELEPDEVSDEGRYVYLELAEALILSEGEHLFVAVPLLGAHPDVMCIAVDDAAEGSGDRNYWSNATEAPYSWVRLESFGLSGSILAVAVGYVVE